MKVGIETDRGPWVAALVAAGYEVFAINPMSVARYRERHSTSGAKSDAAADAHLLAEILRLDRAHHRPLAGDSEEAEAIKLVARTHRSLIWDRTRHVLRLRSALREFFPAALKAFPDLDAPDTLELLAKAPGPDRAAQLTRARSPRHCDGRTAATSRPRPLHQGDPWRYLDVADLFRAREVIAGPRHVHARTRTPGRGTSRCGRMTRMDAG